MTLKKSLSAIAAAVMLFALTACKGGSGKASDLDIKLNGVTVSAPFTVEKLQRGKCQFDDNVQE